jgi:hypothetical protein
MSPDVFLSFFLSLTSLKTKCNSFSSFQVSVTEDSFLVVNESEVWSKD